MTASRLTIESSPPGMTLAAVARGLLRRRRLIVSLALACAMVTGTLGLMRKRTWSSAATFMPQARRTPASGLTGIAAQLGISVPTLDASLGPGFYADFINSKTMRGALADTTFEVVAEGGRVRASLADIMKVSGRTPELRRDAVIRKLGSRIQAVAVVKTGVVRVRAMAETPDLALEIVRCIIDRLNWFNLVTRQSQAGAERRFMEGRLDEARTELRAAEDRLQGFLQRNRDFRNSPELTFQQDRLARDVQVKQQVYTSLAQAYEQARIEEVRDTPVITVVEQPDRPVRPDRRGAARSALVALIAGAMLGTLFAFVMTIMERERALNEDEIAAVQAELRQAVGELRRPWRLLLPRRAAGRAGGIEQSAAD